MLSPILAATPGWTLFSGVFSTVFPLVILSLILHPLHGRPVAAPERMRRTSRRTASAVLVGAVLLGAIVGDAIHLLSASSSTPSATAEVRGQAVWPEGLRPAPDFALSDSKGTRFELSSTRGRPVILTFMDSQLPPGVPAGGPGAGRCLPDDARPPTGRWSSPSASTPGKTRRARCVKRSSGSASRASRGAG